jgi:hypothetical protein
VEPLVCADKALAKAKKTFKMAVASKPSADYQPSAASNFAFKPSADYQPSAATNFASNTSNFASQTSNLASNPVTKAHDTVDSICLEVNLMLVTLTLKRCR